MCYVYCMYHVCLSVSGQNARRQNARGQNASCKNKEYKKAKSFIWMFLKNNPHKK